MHFGDSNLVPSDVHAGLAGVFLVGGWPPLQFTGRAVVLVHLPLSSPSAIVVSPVSSQVGGLLVSVHTSGMGSLAAPGFKPSPHFDSNSW